MPHFILEYSANLEPDLDVAGMVREVHRAAAAAGIFPLAGIRVRAVRCEHVAVANGDRQHGFIDVTCKLGAGRGLEARKAAGEAVFSALSRFLDPLFAGRSLALSFEMREIDPDLSWKRNPIHDALKKAPA